jgi:hypothetical protein
MICYDPERSFIPISPYVSIDSIKRKLAVTVKMASGCGTHFKQPVYTDLAIC